MEIRRIDGYDDPRFTPRILAQHGAFLVDGEPYQIEITGADSAVIHGLPDGRLPGLLEEFRFYAEHITRFYDADGMPLAQYPRIVTFQSAISEIQPSLFAVDAEKLAAVRYFIRGPEDIVIPLIRHEGRYVSLDGHTRLAAAVQAGFSSVMGFLTQAEDGVLDFAAAARERGVLTPFDLPILPHDAYCVVWDRFCDAFFAARKNAGE